MRFPFGMPNQQGPDHPPPPETDVGGGGDAFFSVDPTLPPPTAVEVNLNEKWIPLLGVAPGPNAVDISPSGDGKLWREIIQRSKDNHGDYGARNGMEVKVHYKGVLTNGTVFDSNDETDVPFTFVLGDEKVIAGWDKGLVGTKMGEIVKLIIHADFAYGSGSHGNIPPNSTLIFEIEMVEYCAEDLTKKKTGKILRYNIKPGVCKYLTPNYGSIVEVMIEGKYKDVEIYPNRKEKFRLGDGCDHGIPRGVEKALYKFRSGEGSMLVIQGQNYGISAEDYVKYNIPADGLLEFYVELLSHANKKEPWQMEGLEKLEISRDLKKFGNSFFAKANYRVAFKNYKLIIEHLKTEALLYGDDEEERKQLLLAAYLNMAICNLKLDKPTLAIRNCDDALTLDPKSSKAFFRRGLANLAVNFPDPAKVDFEKVLELEPSNSAACQQIINCDQQIKQNLKKERQMYTKMFSNQSSTSEVHPPSSMDNVSQWNDKTNGNTNTTS